MKLYEGHVALEKSMRQQHVPNSNQEFYERMEEAICKLNNEIRILERNIARSIDCTSSTS